MADQEDRRTEAEGTADHHRVAVLQARLAGTVSLDDLDVAAGGRSTIGEEIPSYQ